MRPLTTEKKQLLLTLSNTWPPEHRIRIEANEIVGLSSHMLAEEIESAVNDRKCCLPFFLKGGSEIAWFNTARDADDLQSTIQSLRCWFIPSYGWEHDEGWIVTETTDAMGIRKQISDMSPAGYCRWLSRVSDFLTIGKKLAQIRFLEKAKPELPPNGPPPLIQIRQQFVTALVAGDKASAENAIRLIEVYQLDSADNSLFMWIRFWFTFREYDRIIQHKDIHRLTQLRIPKVVKHCITKAFYFVHLDGFDWTSDSKNILLAYKQYIHSVVGDLVARSGREEGVEAVRLLACRAITLADPSLAKELESTSKLGALTDELEKLESDASNAAPVPLEDQFWIARSRKDWPKLQEIGLQLVDADPDSYVPLLRQSICFNANKVLEKKLACYEVESPNTRSRKESATATKITPVSWVDWLQSLDDPKDVDFHTFLSDRPEIVVDQLAPQSALELSTLLEEAFLKSEFKSNRMIRHLLLNGLPELMQDFVNEEEYPRDSLVTLYTNLFRLWAELKCGSTHPPDSQVLLNLADGILTFERDLENELVGQFELWWKKSPVKALLPFLLGVVDLLHTKGTQEQCSNFWIAGAEHLKNNPKHLTAGERNLWRQIGSQFFDSATVDEYLPIPATTAEPDPVRAANLSKVAIVSMREPQAKTAAQMIEERSGADVVVVTKKAAGAQTESAATADVVLFVWKATSHAVFRAFDHINKEKLSYVQGTGASSIVLALERWVTEQPK